MGPSRYEDAMAPIYAETAWRERNFYKADDGTNPASTTEIGKISQPSTGIIETVSQPVKDFGDFLKPNGQWNWARVGVIAGGLLIIGIIIGKSR